MEDNKGNINIDLEIKSISEDSGVGIIEGWANVYNYIDYVDDIVERGAARKNLQEKGNKRPLNLEHDYKNFLGVIGVTEFEEMDYGLYTKNEVNLETELGREVYARAKQLHKHGLPVPFSIGYSVPKGKAEFKSVNGRNVRVIKELMLDHNSIVMKPANDMSGAVSVKSLLDTYSENSYISVKSIKSLLNEAVPVADEPKENTSVGEAELKGLSEISDMLRNFNQQIKNDVSKFRGSKRLT